MSTLAVTDLTVRLPQGAPPRAEGARGEGAPARPEAELH